MQKLQNFIFIYHGFKLTTIFYSKKGEKTTPKSEFEWGPDNVQTIIDGVTLLSQYTVREKISPP